MTRPRDFDHSPIEVKLSSATVLLLEQKGSTSHFARLGCISQCESGIRCGPAPIGSNWNSHTQEGFNCVKIEFTLISKEFYIVKAAHWCFEFWKRSNFGFGCDDVPIGPNWNSETQELKRSKIDFNAFKIHMGLCF